MNAEVDINTDKKWKIFAIVQNAIIIILLCFFTLFLFWRMDFSRVDADMFFGHIIFCLAVILVGIIFWFAVSQILLIILDFKSSYIDLRKIFLLKLLLISVFFIVCIVPFKDRLEGEHFWTSFIVMLADFKKYQYPVFVFVLFIILLIVYYLSAVPLIVEKRRELKNIKQGENDVSVNDGGKGLLSKMPYIAIAVLSLLLISCAISFNTVLKVADRGSNYEYSTLPLYSFVILAVIISCLGFLPLILKKARGNKAKRADKIDLQAESGVQPENSESAVSVKENKFKFLERTLYIVSCVISVMPLIIGLIRAL